MWDAVRGLFGEVTTSEVALVAVVFVAIVAYSMAPRLGERLGGLFGRRR